jgi:hypothetical protein
MDFTTGKESRNTEYRVHNSLLQNYKNVKNKNHETSITDAPKNRSISINKSFSDNRPTNITHQRSQSKVMQTIEELK